MDDTDPRPADAPPPTNPAPKPDPGERPADLPAPARARAAAPVDGTAAGKPWVSSPARAAAARANGRKSRGPKTPAGKARSRANAMTHGLHAAAVRPCDTDEHAQIEFDFILKAVRAKFRPNNVLDHIAAENLAMQYVKLARVEQLIGAAMSVPLEYEGQDFPTVAHARQIELEGLADALLGGGGGGDDDVAPAEPVSLRCSPEFEDDVVDAVRLEVRRGLNGLVEQLDGADAAELADALEATQPRGMWDGYPHVATEPTVENADADAADAPPGAGAPGGGEALAEPGVQQGPPVREKGGENARARDGADHAGQVDAAPEADAAAGAGPAAARAPKNPGDGHTPAHCPHRAVMAKYALTIGLPDGATETDFLREVVRGERPVPGAGRAAWARVFRSAAGSERAQSEGFHEQSFALYRRKTQDRQVVTLYDEGRLTAVERLIRLERQVRKNIDQLIAALGGRPPRQPARREDRDGR